MAGRDQLRVEAAVDSALAGTIDDADRALILAWAVAWDAVSADVESAMLALATDYPTGRIPTAALRRDARLQAALAAVYGSLDRMAERAPSLAATGLTAATTGGAAGGVQMIQAGLTGRLRAELRSSVLDADAGQVAAIIERSTQQITARTRHLADEAQAAIRAQMTRGVAEGTNPRRVAALAVRGIEDQWNGGLERARTIARTEMIDAHRTAAQRVHEANADVLEGWEWVAHLGDDRTCRACLAMHGTVHDLDQQGPQGHPNCRCARVPKTKSWEALGFPGMREPESLTPDADAWFDALPEAEQRSVLTDRGYEAWARGDWPREKWASRRTNPDWRPSYQTAKPPTG